MAYITAMVGAAEFALNPVAGHLSDMIGEVLLMHADLEPIASSATMQQCGHAAVWSCSSATMQQCGHAAV
jgi:hypothetical protein